MIPLSLSEKQVTNAITIINKLAYRSYDDRRWSKDAISKTEYNKVMKFCREGSTALKILRRQYESVNKK